jgi:hypothetical protein
MPWRNFHGASQASEIIKRRPCSKACAGDADVSPAATKFDQKNQPHTVFNRRLSGAPSLHFLVFLQSGWSILIAFGFPPM